MIVPRRALILLTCALLTACGAATVNRPRLDVDSPRAPHSVDVSMRYEFKIPGQTSRVRFLIILPQTIQSRQTVEPITFAHERPIRQFERDGTRFAEYVFENPAGDKRTWIDTRIRIVPSDPDAIKASRTRGPRRATRIFMQPERYIESDNPAIVQELQSVQFGSAQSDLTTARALYAHVLRKLNGGGYNPDNVGAAATLRQGRGDCTDYTDLLVALARAKGMPARHVTGFVTSPGDATPKHSWAELYTRELGWIPVDPLWGDLDEAAFDRRPNEYIQMYDNRNEEVINYWRYWYTGDPIQVHETLYVGARTYKEVAAGP